MTLDPVAELLQAEAARKRDDDKRLRADPWRIRLLREARGLTVPQLAERMGYRARLSGRQMVCKMETYATPIGPKRLERLAKGLGVDAAELLSDGPTFRANRAAWKAWIDDGRPYLPAWLMRRAKGEVQP